MVGRVTCCRCLLIWRLDVSRTRNYACLGTITLRCKCFLPPVIALADLNCTVTVPVSAIICTSSTLPRAIFSRWKPSLLIPKHSTTAQTPRDTRRTTLERGKG